MYTYKMIKLKKYYRYDDGKKVLKEFFFFLLAINGIKWYIMIMLTICV